MGRGYGTCTIRSGNICENPSGGVGVYNAGSGVLALCGTTVVAEDMISTGTMYLNADGNAADDRMLADMIAYGNEARKAFGYNYIEGVTELPELPGVSAEVIGNWSATDGVGVSNGQQNKVATTLSLKDRIQLNAYILMMQLRKWGTLPSEKEMRSKNLYRAKIISWTMWKAGLPVLHSLISR